MSKICISSCVNDAKIPVRATYVNLYKWPESDAEFVKSPAMHGGARRHNRVVDRVSCRQMYLRSYTFSRKETLLEKTMKLFSKVREMVAAEREEKGESRRERKVRRRIRRPVLPTKVKDFSTAAFRAILRRRLLSCATSIGVEKLDI